MNLSNLEMNTIADHSKFSKSLRILIVSENASMKMGGEASLPFYYFKLLRKRNIETWMICHSRVREELSQAFLETEEFERIKFIEDSWTQIVLCYISRLFPSRIQELIFYSLIHLITQVQTRQLAKEIIPKLRIDLLFEPSPINPKEISFMSELGIPVAIGPLCGGLEFPPAFRYMDSWISRLSINSGRFLSSFIHQLIPGKLKADTLIVANQRTAVALPKGYQGKIYEVVESGVDLSIWQPIQYNKRQSDTTVRFVYSGRFVDWKGIQFLIEAFKQVSDQTNAILELIGDGNLREIIEARIKQLNLQNQIKTHGWLTREASAKIIQECDVFVMPSLRECGGTAILEAMALGIPVIATNWAGPASYLDASSGILVEPSSPEEFIDGLAQAMLKLATFPELRYQLSEGCLQRIQTNYFDWEAKVDRILEIFQEML